MRPIVFVIICIPTLWLIGLGLVLGAIATPLVVGWQAGRRIAESFFAETKYGMES